MSEERKANGEAKFAAPEDDVGIGYYFDGEPVPADEFGRLVDEKANRLKAEREAARTRAGEAGAASGEAGSS